MTHDESWQYQYEEIIEFMETNHRRPSKHYEEEREMHTWWKHQKKLLNAGKLPEKRIERFNHLLALGEQYRHVNQYF
ncbi:MAG: helicase associated domain-containing protein [Bacteroidales bacterium]|nr:helicase associated domain-containing protein [Bacteroidales bacterium]